MIIINISQIGQTLKQRRLSKKLSIRDLAALSNIAGSTISQIETGKTSPNLLTLKAVCDALGFPVFSLFLDEEPDKVHLVRKSEQQTFIRNISNGISIKESLIVQGKNEMYAALVTTPPNSDSGSYYHHGGEEFIFILSGDLVYDLEDRQNYNLSAYDTLYYPNYIGHRWENHSDKPVEMLMVSTSPYNF